MRKSLLGLLLAVSLPAAASGGMGFYGWGVRLGVADDPDQFVAGFQQDLGEFVENLRFQPSLELGLGDDHTIVALTIPVHYRFETSASVTPYVGGGLQVAWIEHEKRRRDDTEVDIAPVFLGGVEWPLGKASDIFLELHLGPSDAHARKLMVGWMFRAR